METPKTKTTRPSKSLARIAQNAELMLAGLKANISEVEKRGVDAEFISKMENEINRLKINNIEQEKLKSALKLKTEEVNASVDNVSKLFSEAKKVVKLALPQAQWIEFGMDDKK